MIRQKQEIFMSGRARMNFLYVNQDSWLARLAQPTFVWDFLSLHKYSILINSPVIGKIL